MDDTKKQTDTKEGMKLFIVRHTLPNPHLQAACRNLAEVEGFGPETVDRIAVHFWGADAAVDSAAYIEVPDEAVPLFTEMFIDGGYKCRIALEALAEEERQRRSPN
jgi:hypothetical protein